MREALPRRILVTGGSGVLGYQLVQRLLSDRRNRITVPLRNPENRFIRTLPVDIVPADLSDPQQVDRLVRSARPDVVVHSAAVGLQWPKPDWFEMARFNVASTLRLFEATCAIPDCHFIHISTGLAYRETGVPLRESDPLETLHPYGASKAGADLLIRAAAAECGRRLTVLRPFSFTGLHDAAGRLFPALLNCVSQGKPFEMSPGEQIRDFCAVQDIAEGVVRCLECADRGAIDVLNLGSGEAPPLRRLVAGICEELGLSADLRFGAKPYHRYEPLHLLADIGRAKESLGWQPTTNLAFAVWQLAKADFPTLQLKTPRQER